MIPKYVTKGAPHITGRDRFMDGRRHSQRSGLLLTTALYPSIPTMRYYKGGGGLGGIVGGIIIGAVLGALTGGIGAALYAMAPETFAMLSSASILSGAVIGGIGGNLSGTADQLAGVRL